jgi:hypothetical protein
MAATANPRQHTVLHITTSGTQILVRPGSKSRFDFQVRYREPGKRARTPKHIHLIIDLYAKRAGNLDLTNRLVDYIIGTLIGEAQRAGSYPPHLTHFSDAVVSRFSRLDPFGEYPIDFLLPVIELVMTQEKTNYPNGDMNLRLFRSFRNGIGIYEVVSAATFRGPRR